METTKCIICSLPFIGFGHNPAPLANEGECCNQCNGKVIAARLGLVLPTEDDDDDDSDDDDWFDRKYPNASCHRCDEKLCGETVVMCGGGGGACETWYCADCHEEGTWDCCVCGDDDKWHLCHSCDQQMTHDRFEEGKMCCDKPRFGNDE